jgi:signal peptidase II
MDIAHIHNFGVSFGLFAGIIPSIYLVIIGIAVTSLVFYLYIQSKKKLEKWGFILIIAGALSNILDRFINGYVIDFIYIHYKEFYWPAFNFADIYISIGISLLILNLFKNLLIKNDT